MWLKHMRGHHTKGNQLKSGFQILCSLLVTDNIMTICGTWSYVLKNVHVPHGQMLIGTWTFQGDHIPCSTYIRCIFVL